MNDNARNHEREDLKISFKTKHRHKQNVVRGTSIWFLFNFMNDDERNREREDDLSSFNTHTKQ
jgi:hypothetical protein